MKRKLLPVIFVVLILLVQTSCGRRYTADEVAFRLLNLYPTLPPSSQYVKNGEKYGAGYISEEDFGYLYTGEKTILPEWDMIDDFRIILSDATTAFEIHVIRVMTASDTEEIAKLLRRRAELLTLHNKIEEDYLAEEPLVYVSGHYAILVVTSDNEAALRLLKKML